MKGALRALFAAPLLLLAFPAAAPGAVEGLTLDGTFTQGGLVIGRAGPGARVTVDGQAVRVSAEGLFLIGFGRDAPPETEVRAVFADGRSRVRRLAVSRRQYAVQRIDGLPPKQVTPDARALARIKADRRRIAAVRTADTAGSFFASGFAWPTQGRLSGIFGSRRVLNGEARRPHNGVDVAAPEGTPVHAPADGVVVLAARDMFFTGKTVMIDHGHGLTSVFAHMSVLTVGVGERVAKGDLVGRVGRTGRATGAHLHWGVTLFDTHLDPALLAGPMVDGG